MSSQSIGEESGLLFENMRRFISIIDTLRDFGLQGYVSLPRIAVVGLQSAGKSSLLESIVGYDFLPRGEGIVTRVPLELRLVHTPSAEKPFGIFEQYSQEKVKDLTEIKKKIIDYTDKLAGQLKGVVDSPLVLSIYAKETPDLSLVDLPGITKIPVKDSGQPDNIEELTTDLVIRYARDPRTLILCAVQANTDVTTSDAIKLARRFDPDGNRTLCALTKVDLVDIGSDLRRVLNNEEVALRYGYVAIKNRGPSEVRDGLPVNEGLKAEERYFQERYPELLDQRLAGTKNLVNRLSVVLAKNIQSSLPNIQKELKEKIDEFEEQLRDLGTPLPDSKEERLQTVLNLVNEFCSAYSTSVRGRYTKIRKNEDKMPISVRIRKLLISVFREIKNEEIEEMLSDSLIRTSMLNYGASGLPGFPSFSVFQKLLQPLLEQLIPKSNDLLDSVYQIIEQAIIEISDRIFLRLPDLKPTITELALKNLENCKLVANELLDNYLQAEINYLFTIDEQFLESHASIFPVQHMNETNSMNEAFIVEIRQRVLDYFKLIYRNLRDSIPKCIGQMLINESNQKMQVEMFEGINRDSSNIIKCLDEPESITAQRKSCQKALKVLKGCLRKLQEEDLIDEL